MNHKKVANLTDFEDALKDLDKNKRILMLIRHGNMTRFYSLRAE
jgi:hypothetical protein